MIAAVTPDTLAIYVVFAAMVSGCVGFMACAVFASGTIRRNREEYWQEGYDCCNRDHHNAKTNPVRPQ